MAHPPRTECAPPFLWKGGDGTGVVACHAAPTGRAERMRQRSVASAKPTNATAATWFTSRARSPSRWCWALRAANA